MKLYAPAKVNLGLNVRQKRADGFHEVVTLMQAIDWVDTLEVEVSDHFEFHSIGEFQTPSDENNLVVKAVKLLGELYHIEPRLKIILTKQVPPGGGLGGGSSDAVAALIACNSLWNLQLNDQTIEELASQLGSDCPFFVRGGLQLAQGRGEVLTPQHISLDGCFALWYPGVSSGTSGAYRLLNRGLTYDSSAVILYGCLQHGDVDWHDHGFENDFEAVVHDQISGWYDARAHWLQHRAEWVAMTGSGSCQVAYFPTHEAAELACSDWNGQGMVRVAMPLSIGVHYEKARI